MKQSSLGRLGEFGFIARMARPFINGLPKGTRGIGDDCAVLPWTKRESLIVTTDMLIEDRHFVRTWVSAEDLGYKSLAVNLSDIAAMGGWPKWALLSLGIPTGIDLDWLDGFYRGWRRAARPSGVPLVGGDTTKSPGGLVVSVVVGGTVRAGREKLRSAARPGDVVAVTGRLGDSAGGLAVLLGGGPAGERAAVGKRGTAGETVGVTAGRQAAAGLRAALGGATSAGRGADSVHPARRDEAMLVRAHHLPRPHLAEGEWLGARTCVRAMMDVSDGLDSDIRRIMEQSGVGAEIELEKLPVSAELERVARRRGFDPVETAASGGEDYCLLVTIEKTAFAAAADGFARRFRRPLHAVGEIRPKDFGLRYFRGGRPVELSSRGFDHFKTRMQPL